MGRFFFRPARHPTGPVVAGRDSSRLVRVARRSPAPPECFSETALFKGFAKTEIGACAIGDALACLPHADRNTLRGRENAPCRKVHRGAPVSRRTSRFARKCANFSGARGPRFGIGRSSSTSPTTHRCGSRDRFDSPFRRRRRSARDARDRGSRERRHAFGMSARAPWQVRSRGLRITSSSLSELGCSRTQTGRTWRPVAGSVVRRTTACCLPRPCGVARR